MTTQPRHVREVSFRQFRENLREMFDAAAAGEQIVIIDAHRKRRLGTLVACPDRTERKKEGRSTAA